MLATTRRVQGRRRKQRKDYAFWHHYNEKPSIIQGCPRQGRRSDAGTHPDRRDAHADDNALLGEGGEVGGQAEVAAVVGQQYTVAHGAQRLNALDE